MKLTRKVFAATMIVALLVMLIPQVGLADYQWDDCPDPGGVDYVAVAKWEWVGTDTSGNWVYDAGATSILVDAITAASGAPAILVGVENAFNAEWWSPGPINMLYFKDGYGNDWWTYPDPGVYTDYFHFHPGGTTYPSGGDPYPNTTPHPFNWTFGGVSHITFCVKRTAVTLDSFTARASSGKVTLEWKTALEKDNAGFNIYRSMVDGGQLVKVNSTLIGAKAEGATGSSYSFADKPGAGTYYYFLEDVSTSGSTTRHSPVQVTVKPLLRRPVYRPFGPAY